MQTVKNFIENSNPGTIVGKTGKDTHLVFITNESGISSVFESVKAGLGNGSKGCLTLIYSTSAYLSQPLYKAELESLERRFPSRLIIHYVFGRAQNARENLESHQRVLEIVINSNTCMKMQFLVAGQDEFSGMIIGRLKFLGITTNQIISQII